MHAWWVGVRLTVQRWDGSAQSLSCTAQLPTLPSQPHCVLLSQGAGSAPLFSLGAHDKATCALSFCPAVRGIMATSSTDKKVSAGGEMHRLHWGGGRQGGGAPKQQ